ALGARLGQALTPPQDATGTGAPGVSRSRDADETAAGDAGEVTGVAGVVSLLALAEGTVPGCGVVGAGVAGLAGLVQALGDAGIGGRLWVLTRGAVAVTGGEVPVPVQAQAWGLGQVAGLELPGRWGGPV